MKKFKLLFPLFALVLSILPSHIVLADTGPKPTMEFEFKRLQDGDLQIVSGILYECNQSDCSDATPLQELGPQRLTCDTISCHALAYGFAPYHILEIEFSDEATRRSNIFETAGFDSRYTVTVQPNDLLVKSQFGLGVVHPYILMLIIASLCCLVGVGLIVWLIFFFVRRSKRT